MLWGYECSSASGREDQIRSRECGGCEKAPYSERILVLGCSEESPQDKDE